jgi:hypothetical protein
LDIETRGNLISPTPQHLQIGLVVEGRREEVRREKGKPINKKEIFFKF